MPARPSPEVKLQESACDEPLAQSSPSATRAPKRAQWPLSELAAHVELRPECTCKCVSSRRSSTVRYRKHEGPWRLEPDRRQRQTQDRPRGSGRPNAGRRARQRCARRAKVSDCSRRDSRATGRQEQPSLAQAAGSRGRAEVH